jgi:hypothetical protein
VKISPAVSLTWLASCVRGSTTSTRRQSLSASARVDDAARRAAMAASTCSLGKRGKCEVAIVPQPVRASESGVRRPPSAVVAQLDKHPAVFGFLIRMIR